MHSLQQNLHLSLRPLYRNMVSALGRTYRQDVPLYGFAPMVGANYENSTSKLLVVGRAVNGWRKRWDLGFSNCEILSQIFWAHPEDEAFGCPMHWLQRNQLKEKGRQDRYNYRRSSFWSGVRDVLKTLEGRDSVDHSWASSMAWSNVYKISPDRGNPEHPLRASQLDYCKEILRAELELLQPKHILFVTGGWGKKILEDLEIMAPNPQVPDFYNCEIDVGTLGAKVVVASRPEGRKRAQWVARVLDGFLV